MKTKLKPIKKILPPILTVRAEVKRGSVILHLSVRTHWLAAALLVFAAYTINSGMATRLMEVITMVMK